MAHWIIMNHGDYNTYTCSHCGAEFRDDITYEVSRWSYCDNCYHPIDSTENEYRNNLVHRPMIKEETKDSGILGPIEVRRLLGSVFSDIDEEPASIPKENTKNFVMMSLEKYDAMKDEFNICIEERDRELFKLDKEVRELIKERDRYLDILKNMGLTEERAKHIVPGTGKFVEDELNPITMNRKIYCSFDVDGDWRE